MAIEVIRTLQRHKIKVPGEISIVGFDDSWFAKEGPIGLTTVRQPLHEMGALALNQLKRSISSKKKAKLPKVSLKTDLIVRDSSIAPLTKESFY